jgi:hypothetical protein
MNFPFSKINIKSVDTVQNINKIDEQIIRFPTIRNSSLIIGLVILMFISDAANTFLLKSDNQVLRISIIIRGIALIYFVILLLGYARGRQVIGIVSILFLIFLVGGISEIIAGNTYIWFENLNLFFKLSFVFVCWEVLHKYIKNPKTKDRLFRVFEIIILVQSIAIILGFIFKLDIFSSYGQDYRFGYKGFIPAQNEVSGFFIIAVFYYLWKVVNQHKGIVQLLIVLLAGLLTGAKVALIFPLLLLVYFLIWTRGFLSRKVFWFLCLFFVILIPTIVMNFDYLLERLNPTFQYFSYQLSVGNNPDSFSIFMSGRDLYVQNSIQQIFSNKGILNLLFGGHNLSVTSTETDFLDVFLFIGSIGLILFYLFYLKILLNPRNGVINKHQLIFAVVWIGVSSVAGHLVFSAINSMYMAILLLAFTSYQIKEKKIDENGQIV